jgi:hypothetical protein
VLRLREKSNLKFRYVEVNVKTVLVLPYKGAEERKCNMSREERQSLKTINKQSP